jgi:hypothetical protein
LGLLTLPLPLPLPLTLLIYGIQLWDCTSTSDIEAIHPNQNKVLQCIANAPSYFRICGLHRDVGIETVKDISAKFTKARENRLQTLLSIEASRLRNVNNIATQTEETV